MLLVWPAGQCYAQYVPQAAVYEQNVSSRAALQFENNDSAAEYLRSEMKKHSKEISFSYPLPFEKAEGFFEDLLDSVFVETGRGTEGDYLRYGIKEINYHYSGNSKKVTYTVNLEYLTNASQESYVSKRVSEILNSLDLNNKNDYSKLFSIYDWIVRNVSYADSLTGDEVFTAYGALADKKAVCQGFVQLFYRMTMEAGISCRIIGGTADGVNHVWVIAGINGRYYLLDPTWDSSFKGTNKLFFLRGTSDFDEGSPESIHVTGVAGDSKLYPDYNSSGFKKLYPISYKKYSVSDTPSGYSLGDINGDGVIDGTDATLVLRAYGQLSSYGNCGMPSLQRVAADVNSDGAIDGTDATIILKYFSYTLAGHKISFTDFLRRWL